MLRATLLSSGRRVERSSERAEWDRGLERRRELRGSGSTIALSWMVLDPSSGLDSLVFCGCWCRPSCYVFEVGSRSRLSWSARGACAIVVALGMSLVATAACTAPTPSKKPGAGDAPNGDPTSPPDGDALPDVKSADAGGIDETCATVAPNNECGLDPQCGCRATETCDVSDRTTGATSCVVGGSATLGRPCQTTSDCIVGLGCFYGACRPYCKTPLSKCSVGGTELCVSMLSESNKPLPNLSFCTINCDPREPAGVCGANSCHWFATLYAPTSVSDCNFAGPKGVLEPCSANTDCQAGLACIEHATHGRECEKWCRLGVAGDCGPDPKFVCKDLFGANAPVINGQKEGICQD
jgi:hypothetical protein